MERREVRPAADDDRMETSEVGQMVACELEAAAALAGLARCPAPTGGNLGSGDLKGKFIVREGVDTSTRDSEEQPVATQHLCDNVFTAISNSEKTEAVVENIPSHNPVSKLKSKPTEADKEARKIRRVLANRESARQTIRRRQATYLELTGKATELLEENEILKKEMEVAVKEYNSLRDRNEIFKAQLAKLKKTEAGNIQSEPDSSQTERSSSNSTPPIYLHHKPSIVPCFWPSIFPSPDAFQFQNDAGSSQFHMPAGQERQGAPLFILPVPCLLPFLVQNSTLHSHSDTTDRRNTTHPSSSSCSEQNTRTEASDSKDNPVSADICQYIENHPKESSACNVNVASAAENTGRGSLGDENEEPIIGPDSKSDEVFAATVARRRRKELMKLKNKHCHHLDNTRF